MSAYPIVVRFHQLQRCIRLTMVASKYVVLSYGNVRYLRTDACWFALGTYNFILLFGRT